MIGKVLESSANAIIVKMTFNDFETNKESLKIGKYVKIEIGNHDFLLATINNIKAISDGTQEDKYLLTVEPVGTVINNNFKAGGSILPSPTEPVHIADEQTLGSVFLHNSKFNFEIGKLIQDNNTKLYLDGNSLFSKHIAIVGSTGSGKSCTVAKILQEAVGIREKSNIHIDRQRNSHIIIFDIHSEYKAAFSLEDDQHFTLNYLDVEKLKLPYWLLNSEELEALFIESKETNSHNQISQFKKAVIANKVKHNPTISKITYDTPVYFSIREVFNYINNLNDEVISKLPGENLLPKTTEEPELIRDKNTYFDKIYTFVPTSKAKDSKATNGPFNGEFNRFISRLDNKINDKRLEFIMNATKEDGTNYQTEDFNEIIKQFLGYINKSNITIIDLSGVPFEVLSITVSLISRLVFDFCFHYSKLRHSIGETNDVPFLIVCEEAHNYVPKSDISDYKASKKSIERIAKEGRKYGLSLMVVSQRPSEVSDTIFSQCNNFISLRLTNMSDQSYIKNLLPNNTNSIAEILPVLGPGECLVVGDATPIPSIVSVDMPNPRPHSENVKVRDIWNEDWKTIDIEEENKVILDDVIKRWRGEEIDRQIS